MKLFLVTRGSQGDIYPYLALATSLIDRGHDVTLSLPRIFEKLVKDFRIPYILQAYDDIGGMIEDAAETNQKTKHLLKWVRRVIDKQFEEFIPILEQHDVLVSANTEFAAASLAEYCKKPFIRTAFAPFLPGTKIPPPVMPWPKANPVFTPRFLWKMLNKGTNFMVLKTLNKNRIKLGMAPIKNFGIHAVESANNFLMYSRHVGNTDPTWTYKWDIGGYCFNDNLPYKESTYNELISFIKKDDRPTLFFTLGSCNAKNKDRICQWILQICNKHHFKLVVGSGWSKTGNNLTDEKNLFLIDKPIPHSIIFPECEAIIHHGGCGTTHSVARAGKPQMIFPLIIDQHYWGNRVYDLGIGPDRVKIAKISRKELEANVCDLMNNPAYKKNAAELKEKIRHENGIEATCDFIENTYLCLTDEKVLNKNNE